MTFAKHKVEVRMRRKAWRPMNIGVKMYSMLRTPNSYYKAYRGRK